MMTSKVSDQHPYPPCRVCNAKASGYHFGVVSCEACKIFFRRSLSQKTPYRCKRNDGQCLIQPSVRTPCSSCRLQKCLKLGMSKEGVKRGRYTLEVKDKTKKALEELVQKTELERSERDRAVQEREERLRSLVDTLVQVDHRHQLCPPHLMPVVLQKQKEYLEYVKMRNAVFGPMNPLPYEEYVAVYCKTGIDIDNLRTKLAKCASKVEEALITLVEYAKDVPGFKALCTEDQINLLRGNSTDWFLLGNMHLVDCENEVFTCTSCMNIYTITDMKTFNDFSGEDLLQSTKIFQSLKLTSQELSVLKAVCITNPDSCENLQKDRAQIEKYHNSFVEALQYLLEKRKPWETATLMGKISNALTFMRNARHKMNGHVWYSMFPDIKSPHLVIELFGPSSQTESMSDQSSSANLPDSSDSSAPDTQSDTQLHTA